MEEIWKPVKGYEGCYEVSNLGRVKSLYSNKILKPRKMVVNSHYTSLHVGLYKYKKQTNYLVARLVASAFCENKKYRKCVNHIDFNPQNNISSNLEWVSYKENSSHSQKAGRLIKTSDEKIETIKYLVSKGYRLHDIARLYDCSTSNLNEIYKKYCV